MSKFMLVVFTDAVEGREGDYNDWYNNTHLQDVVGARGYARAQRFKVQIPMVGQFAHRYLALYEMDAEGPEGVAVARKALSETKMYISDALAGGTVAAVFQQFGSTVESKQTPSTGNFRMAVTAKPRPGREGDYDQWYTHQHLPDVVGTPGISWGKRYKLFETMNSECPFTSFSLYGFSADDLAGVGETLKTIGAANYPSSDASDPEITRCAVFEACSALVEGPKEKAPA